MTSTGARGKSGERRAAKSLRTIERATSKRQSTSLENSRSGGASSTKPARSASDNRQIIILGMHRSGTSALTGALDRMGIYVGSDDELMGKSWANPTGFYEREDAHKICETLLHQSGAAWWKVSSFHPDNARFETVRAQRAAIRDLVQRLDGHGTWALKNPRLCLLLPIFQGALSKPLAIVTVRHPVEIARSLRRRNGFTVQAGLALWEAYTVSLLRSALSMDHVFVDYDDLVRDPIAALGTLAAELASRGVIGLNVESGAASIQSALYRERYDEDSDSGLLSPAQLTLWTELSGVREWKGVPHVSQAALTVLSEFEADETARQEARNSIRKLTEKVAALETKDGETSNKAKEASQQLSELSGQLAQIKKDVATRDETLERLRSQLAANDSQLAAKQTAIDELRTRLGEQNERLAAEGRSIEQLRAELAARDSRACEAQAALSELRSRYAEQSERLVAEGRLAGELRGELTVWRSRALEEQAGLSEFRSRYAEQGERLAAAGREVDSIRARLTESQARALADQAALNDLRGRYAEQSDRLAMAGQQIEELEGRLLAGSSETSLLRSKLDALQAERIEQGAKVDVFQQQEEELRTALAGRDKELAEVKQCGEALRAEALARDVRVAELLGTLEASKAETAELKTQLVARDSHLSQLRAALESARKHSVVREEPSKRSNFDVIERQNKELRDRLTEAGHELERERRRCEALDAKLQRQRAKSHRQHERAARLKANMNSLAEHNEEVEARLSAIENSRSWRAVSALSRLRQRVTFAKDSKPAAPQVKRSESLPSKEPGGGAPSKTDPSSARHTLGSSPVVKGDLNSSSGERTISGSLAVTGEDASRAARVTVEDSAVEVTANPYRTDLKEEGINAGRHGLSLVVPERSLVAKDSRNKLAAPQVKRSESLPSREPGRAAPTETDPGSARQTSGSSPVLKGDLNSSSGERTIGGWLAVMGEDAPRAARVTVDNSAFEVTANLYRTDLKEKGINAGRHGFSLVVPERFLDQAAHKVALYDAVTGKLVATREMQWKSPRNFTDFQGMLKYSMTNPLIAAPFKAADKRCFAFMENVANLLCRRAMALEDKPLVSVVMPAFNRGKVIGHAISSVLTQNYPHFELIVIDDGSVDDTVAVVRSIQDERLRLIQLAQNEGPSRARNVGLSASRGTLIAYLDTDNEWDDRYLAALVGAFHSLPQADAIYSGMLLYRDKGLEPFAVRYGHYNRALLENRNYIDLNVFSHRRRMLESVQGFDESLRRYVDYDLILRASEVCSLYSVPVLLARYFYDRCENTITRTKEYSDQIQVVHGRMEDRRAKREASLSEAALEHDVTVVIPSYQALNDIRECIDGLAKYDWNGKLEIIVVDNASDTDVVEFLRTEAKRGRIKLIENSHNMGFTYSTNQGIRASRPGSDIMLLNNDAIATKAAVLALQRACYRLPDAAITVPRQVLPGLTKSINGHVPYANSNRPCDVNLSAHHDNIQALAPFHTGSPVELSFAPFFAAYTRRDALESAGLLDAEYGRHYRSDRIYCDVVRHVLHRKIYYIPEAIVVHKLQQATEQLRDSKNGPSEFRLMFQRNQWDKEMADKLGYRTAPWDTFGDAIGK